MTGRCTCIPNEVKSLYTVFIHYILHIFRIIYPAFTLLHPTLVSPHRNWLRDGIRKKITIVNIPKLLSERLYNKHMGGGDIILHFRAFVPVHLLMLLLLRKTKEEILLGQSPL